MTTTSTPTTPPTVARPAPSAGPPAPLGYQARPSASKSRGRKSPARWLAFAAICCISVGYLLPLVWMFSTSIKTLPEAMRFPPQWIPSHVDWHGSSPIPENYWRVVTHDKMDFPRYTRNTLWIAALAVLGTSISSSLVAYGFAKIKFKGRSFLFALMLSTMMVPFPVLMVSLFSIYKWTGDHTPLQMLGTLRPLWLP